MKRREFMKRSAGGVMFFPAVHLGDKILGPVLPAKYDTFDLEAIDALRDYVDLEDVVRSELRNFWTERIDHHLFRGAVGRYNGFNWSES